MDIKFDIRTRERALRVGDCTKQDLEGYLKKLPDESKNAVEVAVYEEKTADAPSATLTFSAGNEA